VIIMKTVMMTLRIDCFQVKMRRRSPSGLLIAGNECNADDEGENDRGLTATDTKT